MERDSGSGARGHRALPHTADLILEAWGPDRRSCLEEAVLGLVAGFADTAGLAPSREVAFSIEAGGDDELLVGLLDEVVYLLDARGVLPVAVDLDGDAAGPGAVTGRFHTVAVGAAAPVGAVPKAISWHGLWFGEETPGRWLARATVDV